MTDHTNTTPTPASDMAPVAPASVDAEPIALAAEFQQVDAYMTALGAHDAVPGANGDTWESAGAAVQDRWWQIVNRVIDMPAHTQAGWAAKASMIPGVFRDLGDEDTADHTLALSLVRDLTGQEGPGPDAELLTACEAFHRIHAEMKDPRRGDTDEDDVALGLVVGRWYAALDTAVAIPAHDRRPTGEAADGLHRALRRNEGRAGVRQPRGIRHPCRLE
jgi:hypothetical protein